jgi:replicative superfamily II helicase
MIQELADKVWKNQNFQSTAKAIEKLWLANELNLRKPRTVNEGSTARAMSAAAILACSNNLQHRIAALRLATYIFEINESSQLPFDSALRVVLTRLGNFPSIGTRTQVESAMKTLPWILATEELVASDSHTVEISGKPHLLTDFQFSLWQNLKSRHSVAFSAPTSGGKSFVLELYLAGLFDAGRRSVVYLVPTRALISQVSAEIASLFRSQGGATPEISTVPLGADATIPAKVIYVMTQERVHLTLQSHPQFYADVVIVDEAHSISEGSRGILLQTVIEELLARNSEAQILFASPTTRNLDTFGRLFRRPDISKQLSREPTVSQNFLLTKSNYPSTGVVTITAARESGRLAKVGEKSIALSLRSRIDKLAHIPIALCHGHPNLIYANGADEAEDIAIKIAKNLPKINGSRRLFDLAQLSRESVHKQYVLSECVEKGVAFHYANIPTVLRQEVERAFSDGELKYLVCTSTLLQGVNLPAKNIFMLKPTRGQGKPLESADFWNLAGRAGRLRREFQGNIFLIDYEHWPNKSLAGAKDVDIVPAIERSIKYSAEGLANIIQGKGINGSKSKKVELESAFVRLFNDFKIAKLDETLERLSLNDNEKLKLKRSLEEAETSITLPVDILKRTHNVSAHKQQRLYQRLRDISNMELDKVNALIPAQPEEAQAFTSYANALKLCHEIILGIDTSKNLHRFHALLAKKWMLGWSLPRIISEQIKRNKREDTRKVIRSTLETIEEAIRFQTIRLFGCYNAMLECILLEVGVSDPEKRIPNVGLYLEVGASNQTTVSFISLGLSRALAIRLNGVRSEHDPQLNVDEALKWLRTNVESLESFGLSPFQIEETKQLLNRTSLR